MVCQKCGSSKCSSLRDDKGYQPCQYSHYVMVENPSGGFQVVPIKKP